MHTAQYIANAHGLARLAQRLWCASPSPGLAVRCDLFAAKNQSRPLFTFGGRIAFFSTSRLRLAKIRLGPGKDAFAKVKFKKTDIPSFDFWADKARPPLVSDLSPEECAATIEKYADLAIENAPKWREKLTTDHQISLYTLHYIAAMVIMRPPSPAWHMAIHILHTAVRLSYAPSILTIVRLAHMRNLLGQTQFAQAEEAFARVLACRDNPDACTLKGLILAARDRPDADVKALDWFRLAVQIGGEEPGAWNWQASCYTGMAKIYLKQGEKEKARETLRHAANRLDVPEACWLYANTLAQDDADRAVWFKKAVVSGNMAAARELAQLELRDIDNASLSRREKEEKQAFADEWLAIAGDKALL